MSLDAELSTATASTSTRLSQLRQPTQPDSTPTAQDCVTVLSVVHPDFLPSLYSLSHVLQQHGMRVDIFSFASPARESPLWRSVGLHVCGSGAGGALKRWDARRSLVAAAAALTRSQPPLAIVATCPFTFLSALRIARRELPVLYLAYETYEVPPRYALGSPLSWFRSWRAFRRLREAALVCAPSPERSGWLAGRASLERIPSTVLNSPSRAQSRRETPTGALGHLLSAEMLGRRLVIHTGNVSPAQAIVEVVESVRDWPDDACLVVTNVGTSPYDEEVRTRAVHSPRRQDIVLLPAIARSEMLALQARASVGLFFARETDALETRMPAPNKVGEYLHASLLTAASRSTYMEMLEQHGVAILSDLLSPEGIAKAVREALICSSEPHRQARIHEVADGWYNMETQARPILRALSEARAQRARRRAGTPR